MNHEIYKLDNAGFTLAEITEMLGVRREVVRRAIKIQRDREREVKRYIISRNKKPEE